MNTLIVCGGRSYSDWGTVLRELGAAHAASKLELVVTGGAQGADSLAAAWARSVGCPVYQVSAKWKEHGRAAGPIRNAEMLRLYPDAKVIAFPGGAGTADMVERARKAGREVTVVEGRNDPTPTGA